MIEIPKPHFSFFFSVVMAVFVVLGASTRIQAGGFTSNINTPSRQEKVAGTDPATEPAFRDYKGVRIGMSADEVAEKLGEPAVKDENEGVFLISDVEMVQVFYDKAGVLGGGPKMGHRLFVKAKSQLRISQPRSTAPILTQNISMRLCW